MLSVSNLGAPPVLILRVLDLLGCTFLSCLGLDYLSFILPRQIFGFAWGEFVGVGGVIMIGLKHDERLGVLSGLMLLTLGYGTL